ncbi:MAG TPA: AgmX/PglI C-terminal domain-containing protein [Polyangiaceae bacterium]|nr:AgmX/PglI C-terminal domain-containing protein [Polyangiaceae bacterium]
MAQPAYNYDFSAPFKSHADALSGFRAQEAAPAVAVETLPVDRDQRVGFVLKKSAPALAPSEVEQAGVDALEITVLWGANVLHVAHLTPPRSFTVGEIAGADFLLPQDKIGCDRLTLVSVEGGSVSLIVPANASGQITHGETRTDLAALRDGAEASAELPGARRIPLGAGTCAELRIGDFQFRVGVVTAGKPTKHGIGAAWDRTVAAYFGGAFFVHAALMAGLAAFVPGYGLNDDEGMDKERLYVMQSYLDTAAEREELKKETQQDGPKNDEGGTGERAQGDEGQMGKATAKTTNARWAIKGDKNNPDPHMSRAEALREAQTFGMIGLINTGLAGDPNAPTAPWGRDTSSGLDAISAQGNMWGDTIGEAFGKGGLGLTGLGEGGGGRGLGIGLGEIGFGHGAGLSHGDGFGKGVGRLNGTRESKGAPQVRPAVTTVSGRLPSEVIQRIVRQNFGRFRMCYQQGLTKNPNLEGRVTARFVIDNTGAVSQVMAGSSDLPDSTVKSCVLSAFYGLSFPAPDGGIVTVSYPIMFAPG